MPDKYEQHLSASEARALHAVITDAQGDEELRHYTNKSKRLERELTEAKARAEAAEAKLEWLRAQGVKACVDGDVRHAYRIYGPEERIATPEEFYAALDAAISDSPAPGGEPE